MIQKTKGKYAVCDFVYSDFWLSRRPSEISPSSKLHQCLRFSKEMRGELPDPLSGIIDPQTLVRDGEDVFLEVGSARLFLPRKTGTVHDDE